MAVLSPVRKFILYFGAFLVGIGIIIALVSPGFSITYTTLAIIVIGLGLMLFAVLLGFMVKHKRTTLVAIFIVGILLLLTFNPYPIAGPAPAPGAPAFASFSDPVAKTSNLMVQGHTMNITGTGTVVFTMTITNIGASDSAQGLRLQFANSREGTVWESGMPMPTMGDIKAIRAFYTNFGIVGPSVATFSLSSRQSLSFQFEIDTTYPTGWTSLPASLLGHFSVAGMDGDSLTLNAPPTPPATLL